ncbi:MAG: type III-B CRISPR module RAMP protein Cmr1 [Desulfotomaculaceae bacterium]|nr:type III-B CRISPR module RAMP protein Cmr1 [Desulfotomaculaceae bacterium]
MEHLFFECETITPMFLAGADSSVPELRPPSIKGILRFWWRALQADKNEFKVKEEKIFGGVSEGGLKSSFSIKVSGDSRGSMENYISRESLKKHPYKVNRFELNILEYLAYGTYDYIKGKGNVFNRSYIKPGYKFTIEIITGTNAWERDELAGALRMFFLFGAIGSKARNGFGSFRLIKSNPSDLIQTGLPDLGMIEKYLGYKGIPSYSAFSANARLFKTKGKFYDWDSCLAELGYVYRDCRLSLKPRQKRQYIGAPLIINKQYESILDRHAKPYFMKVHKQDNEFTGFILYLPSLYCTGLQKDREGNQINHELVNKNFLKYSAELNDKLAGRMEVIR